MTLYHCKAEINQHQLCGGCECPCHTPEKPDIPVFFREPYTVEAQYDPEKGELAFIDERVKRVLQIRAGFEEQATRRAAIIELELLGYTVIPPQVDPLGPGGYSSGQTPEGAPE